MAFSHKHRFQKKYNISYLWKMNVKDVAEISGEPIELLQEIYDEEYAKTNSFNKSMLMVYNYCNRGKVFKLKNSKQNTNVST